MKDFSFYTKQSYNSIYFKIGLILKLTRRWQTIKPGKIFIYFNILGYHIF